jgi:5-methylcytosine-specific restriction endonuclease McrA
VFVNPIGQINNLQSLTGDIIPAQRRALVARDRHCVSKGCTRPPAFTDVHHLTHREDGGATALDNLVLLCRRHHVLWHKEQITLNDLHVPWLTRRPTGLPPPELLRQN